MKRVGKGKRVTAFLLAALMLVSAAFCTEVPVSAYTFKTTIANSLVTTKIQQVGRYSVRIQWDKSRLANGYAIYRKEGNQPYKRIKTVGSNVSSYLDQSRVSATQYQYAVRAFRKENRGTDVMSKYKAVPVATRPEMTSIQAEVNSSTQITASWKKIPRVDGYRVYRKASLQKWKLLADVSSNTTSYVDKKASSNTKYVYTVRPYKKSGTQKWEATYKVGNQVIESNVVKTPSDSSGSSDGSGSGNNAKYGASQKEVMKKILYAVESGGQIYGNQDYTDFTEPYTNSSAEDAITIGAGQWYANEARRLLHLIHDTMSAAEYAKYDPKNCVWNDVKYISEGGKYKSWSNYRLSEESDKARIIVKLISSSVGRKCQDQLMYQQIEEMEAEIRKLGVTEARAVGMLINNRHQGGYSAVTRILKKTKKPVTLDNIYAALQTDTGNQVGAYRTRQKLVYNWLKTYMK